MNVFFVSLRPKTSSLNSRFTSSTCFVVEARAPGLLGILHGLVF